MNHCKKSIRDKWLTLRYLALRKYLSQPRVLDILCIRYGLADYYVLQRVTKTKKEWKQEKL